MLRRFGSFHISTKSREELVAQFWQDHRTRRRGLKVFDANGHALSLARCNAEYRAVIEAADLIHADGGFLVTLSKWFKGIPIEERSATTDMIHDFAQSCAGTDAGFFLLGADAETNKNAVEALHRKYPNLSIVGAEHGYFSDAELPQLVARINAAKPAILWLGLGKPREQILASQIASQITATWIVTCGGCFNFLAGGYSRAPQWMQRANLEWLYRLIFNPRKLFWRYAITNPHALWIAFTDRD